MEFKGNPILDAFAAHYANCGDRAALVELKYEQPEPAAYQPPAAIGTTVEIRVGARVRIAPSEPEIGASPILTSQPQQLTVDRASGDYIGVRNHDGRIVFYHRDDIVLPKSAANTFAQALGDISAGRSALSDLVDAMGRGKR